MKSQGKANIFFSLGLFHRLILLNSLSRYDCGNNDILLQMISVGVFMPAARAVYKAVRRRLGIYLIAKPTDFYLNCIASFTIEQLFGATARSKGKALTHDYVHGLK